MASLERFYKNVLEFVDCKKSNIFGHFSRFLLKFTTSLPRQIWRMKKVEKFFKNLFGYRTYTALFRLKFTSAFSFSAASPTCSEGSSAAFDDFQEVEDIALCGFSAIPNAQKYLHDIIRYFAFSTNFATFRTFYRVLSIILRYLTRINLLSIYGMIDVCCRGVVFTLPY